MQDFRTTTPEDAGRFEAHYADRDDDRPTLAELERDEWEAHRAPEAGEGIRCAHCHGRHWTVTEVKACAGQEAPEMHEAPRWKIGPDPWGPLDTSDEPPF